MWGDRFMGLIRGITVTLYEEKQKTDEAGNTIVDGFGKPVCYEEPVDIENVLVSPEISDDIVTSTDLTGKKVTYILAIPKGDTHDWRDKKVEFFGEKFKVFGVPIKGIDDLIPLDWNMKVKVERYE